MAHLATKSQTRSQCKGAEAPIHNSERNTALQIHCAINLSVAHLPTSGKQLISSFSADQNQAMLYNIHLLPDNISVVGPSVLPSGNHISGQTYTLDTHQKNKKSTQDVGSKHAARKC